MVRPTRQVRFRRSLDGRLDLCGTGDTAFILERPEEAVLLDKSFTTALSMCSSIAMLVSCSANQLLVSSAAKVR